MSDGKTVEAAIERALEQLNAAVAHVRVEVPQPGPSRAVYVRISPVLRALVSEVQQAERAKTETLVASAEHALLQLGYMRADFSPEWTELETALTPFRGDCTGCDTKAAPPMHHDSAPYFCDYANETAIRSRGSASASEGDKKGEGE